MTAKYCPGPKAEQEHWLMDFVAGQVDYTLTRPTLQLTAGDKTLQMQNLAAAEPLG